MILVAVGSSAIPFDRLLEAVDSLDPGEPVVVQRGPSKVLPRYATVVDFMAFEEIVEHVERARVVVTHAGVGTILISLMKGKRPIVVPRLRKYGEAVDDHQLELARRLHDEDVVTLAEDLVELSAAVRAYGTARPDPSLNDGALVRELRSLLHGLVTPDAMASPVEIASTVEMQ